MHTISLFAYLSEWAWGCRLAAPRGFYIFRSDVDDILAAAGHPLWHDLQTEGPGMGYASAGARYGDGVGSKCGSAAHFDGHSGFP